MAWLRFDAVSMGVDFFRLGEIDVVGLVVVEFLGDGVKGLEEIQHLGLGLARSAILLLYGVFDLVTEGLPFTLRQHALAHKVLDLVKQILNLLGLVHLTLFRADHSRELPYRPRRRDERGALGDGLERR